MKQLKNILQDFERSVDSARIDALQSLGEIYPLGKKATGYIDCGHTNTLVSGKITRINLTLCGKILIYIKSGKKTTPFAVCNVSVTA